MNFIRRMDRKNHVQCTDIASTTFDPAMYGKTMDELMAEIHGRLPDGTMIRGVEVFRRIYDAVGLGLLSDVSRIWGVRQVVEVAYAKFAKNRLRLTGRCDANGCAIPRPG